MIWFIFCAPVVVLLLLLLLGGKVELDRMLVVEWVLSDRVAKETGVECIAKVTYVHNMYIHVVLVVV